ncbi:RNA polymerase, sigma-24 subunit, ECF subfamily [Paenibacillus mucilaginosus KNP414]|uniref:RNA polymerase, sigma-24 subunit, ECF subfamily n=1 Tax=Paenibacillus mucilaginosus (strain KNP414) TaxID=1036673 RepID=F8FLG7_PAEMK|nr:RNA polymerase, sigma-24 subunit, ECF subfamily [Paenibacillus mucilaginosus KNP414]
MTEGKWMTDWTPILLPYCLRITGSRWDAEDLAQDTAMKLMEAVRRQPQRPVTKAFVYRIAKNAWIDEQRKHKIQGVPWEETKEEAAADPSLTTRELLEQLAERLPPRLGVILLLMDVFDFTAKETAGYLQMKEAAVQVSLGRARVRLRQLAQGPFRLYPGTQSLGFRGVVAAPFWAGVCRPVQPGGIAGHSEAVGRPMAAFGRNGGADRQSVPEQGRRSHVPDDLRSEADRSAV